MRLAKRRARVDHHVAVGGERIGINQTQDMPSRVEALVSDAHLLSVPSKRGATMIGEHLLNQAVAFRIAPKYQVVVGYVFGCDIAIEFHTRLSAEEVNANAR